MPSTTKPGSKRLRFFDALRGFSVVSMVLFHLSYDLYFLYQVPLPFFEPPFRDIWRASISWTFLLIAGIMCSFSRNNARRALKYGLVALIIFVVTTVAAFDTPINFGIIFCMAASTAVAAALQKADVFGHHDAVLACVLAVLFIVCLPLPSGYLGIGPMHLALPPALYSTPWFSWLGFVGPGFASGDYYPLLPYTLLFLSGAFFGSHVMNHGGFPKWCHERGCAPLEFIGKHALDVYVLHQPLIFLVLSLCFAA